MKKILIIEDAPDVRELITACLTSNGFQTVTAEDGLQGVVLAQKHLPDLIICDVNMPNLDGYGTLAALRQDAATSSIPFVFLTGVADKDHVRQGMDLGADDYLTKPFALHELTAAVNTRLRKQAELLKKSERKLHELRGSISLALPHELLTPLNGIIGFSSILIQDYKSVRPEEVQEFAQHIFTSASRLHRLIENFLIYSHLELIANDPEKLAAFKENDRVFVGDIVSQAASLKARNAKREPDLRVEIENGEITVSPENLKKILEEVIDNAFKFSEPGTPVCIRTARQRNLFTVSISDRGRGMNADQIANVGAHMQFERKFYEQQGSGLGLSIAQRMVELHGGRLGIESTPGQETTVHITFPVPVDSFAS